MLPTLPTDMVPDMAIDINGVSIKLVLDWSSDATCMGARTVWLR
jgi:hypothetical protein